jgi:adiponectin receptor
LPDYIRDNEYILRHYRSDWPIPESLLSIFSIHNETLNIWTSAFIPTHFLSLSLPLSLHFLSLSSSHSCRSVCAFLICPLQVGIL